MPVDPYLDPAGTPADPPQLSDMAATTRELHSRINATIRETGVPYLHPDGESVQLDLMSSGAMVTWQERKARALFLGEECWSELPQIYGRYGTEPSRRLLTEVRKLEHAAAVVLTDGGMQACALLLDALLDTGDHALVMRSSYNKTKAYATRLTRRLGGSITLLDDDQLPDLAAHLRENTRVVFVETFTNPLTRAIDAAALAAVIVSARKKGARRLKLIVDNTIATPWGLKAPLLGLEGVDFVVASGTKALAGQDRDLWGYIASNQLDALNEVMDLQAMRGGILDWRRAAAIMAGLPAARPRFERRCQSATQIAAFLAHHPMIGEVYHPSLADHPDSQVIRAHYRMHGSLLSFRLRGADEPATRHFCDVLAMTGVPRYALSFDGLTTKLNHHSSVSEYFTAPEEVKRIGVDRLVRLAVGIEEPQDIVACLNWALWHYGDLDQKQTEAWRQRRVQELGLAASDSPAQQTPTPAS